MSTYVQASLDIPKINLGKQYQDLIDRFIAHQDIAPRSRISYKNALKQFFVWYKKHKIQNPTRETILAYKEFLDHLGLTPFTRSNYLVVVRKFFEWTESLKLYPNIAKGIKGAKKSIKHHQKHSLSIVNIKELLLMIDRRTLEGKRNFALINVLIRTGLRLIEIVRADVGDISIENSEALLWIRGKGKGGKDDFVLLTPEALEPILDYLKARKRCHPQEPLFTSLSDRNYGQRLTTYTLSRLIKKHLRFIGLNSKRYTAHSLRHTFGVLAMQAGASLYEVQLAMRHTAPTTTEIYLGDIERQKRIEAAPERRLNEFLMREGIGLNNNLLC